MQHTNSCNQPPDFKSEAIAAHGPLLKSFVGLTGRIGILGGSFDPPHAGHLYIAQQVKQALNLDHVVLIPTPQNPLKERGPKASQLDRLEMLYSLLEDQNGLYVSAIELNQNSPTYSIDTMSAIKSDIHKDASLHLIIGNDNLKDLHKWKDVDRLLDLVSIISVARPNTEPVSRAELVKRFGEQRADDLINNVINTTSNPASSTQIRTDLAAGRLPEAELTDGVANYIDSRSPY